MSSHTRRQLRTLVANKVATFRLLALDHYVNHVAGIELYCSSVVQNLLQGNQSLGLQAYIHNQVLLGLLDHRAGDQLVTIGFDGGCLGGLFAFKRGKRC